jgi:predicted transcriptional regulator of viral defense system
MTTENIRENLHRSLPHGLRNVVGELELRGATVVSAERVAEYAGAPAGSSAAYDVIRRLVAARWLRPLPVKGHYEFLPGAAGPFSREDTLDPLRAMFADSDVPGQVVLSGAAFLRGFAGRAPMQFDVLLPRSKSVWAALRSRYRFHWVTSDRIFGAELLDGVPVSTRERLLVDVALWPDAVGGALRDRDHWLGRVLEGTTATTVVQLLRRLDSTTATARAGYLAHAFGREDLASAIAELGRSRVTVPLLPRTEPTPAARRDKRFNVEDPIGAATAA